MKQKWFQVFKEMELYTRDFVLTDPSEEMNKMWEMFREPGKEIMFNSLRVTQDPGEDFVGPLRRYLDDDDTPDHFNIKERRLDPQGFNTIIHNDAWFNNMLFK